jgi:hypothetical protein
MRGAPATAVQELAGHQDLADDAAVHAPEPRQHDAAIRLLDESGPGEAGPHDGSRGGIVEAAGKSS